MENLLFSLPAPTNHGLQAPCHKLLYRRIRISLPARNFPRQAIKLLGCRIRLQGLRDEAFAQQLKDAPTRYCPPPPVSGFHLQMKVTIFLNRRRKLLNSLAIGGYSLDDWRFP